MVRRFLVPGRCIRVSLASLIFALASMLACTVFAQNENETVGFSSTHIFDGGYFGENIDTLNGNLALTIPIGPSFHVNRALSYQLKLMYNSRVWDYKDAVVVHRNHASHFGLLQAPGIGGWDAESGGSGCRGSGGIIHAVVDGTRGMEWGMRVRVSG